MDKYLIRFEDVEYEYYLLKKTKNFNNILIEYGKQNIFVIYDENVDSFMLNELFSQNSYTTISVKISEKEKGISTIETLGQKLLALGVSRESCLLAVGGGILGNIVGVLAALLFRGIRLIHMPTTLIACADSVISLKQAINLGKSKNVLGVYYRPSCVCTSIELLETLSKRDIISGYVELVKNLIIVVPNFIQEFLDVTKNYEEINYENIKWLLEVSLLAKQTIMKKDKFEKKEGILLEYGHTVGHGLELFTDGIINHGEGVAIGILVAGLISKEMGGFTDNDIEMQISLLNKIGIIDDIKSRLKGFKINVDKLMNYIALDNKRGYLYQGKNMVPMVILKSFGEPMRTKERPLTLTKQEVLKQCMKKVIGELGGVVE